MDSIFIGTRIRQGLPGNQFQYLISEQYPAPSDSLQTLAIFLYYNRL